MIRLRTRTMKTRQSNNAPWVSSVVKANADLEPAFDAIDNVAGCIGVVVDGNTTEYTGGASEGQYVILRNSTITGCDDGLYTVATGKSISAGSPIDATFLTSVSGGGLNSLRNSLNNKTMTFETVTLPFTPLDNGLLLVKASLTAQGRGYITYNGVLDNYFIDGFNAAGGNITAVIPVTRGTQVSVKASSNINSSDYMFVKS